MNTKPINIRIDDNIDAALNKAVAATGLPKADIMRQSLALGLKDLELMKYDLIGAIHDRVLAVRGESPRPKPLAPVSKPRAAR